MMNRGADRIVQRILADARSRAEALVAEAKEQATRVIDGAEKRAIDQQKQDLKQAELQAAEESRCILGSVQLEARKNMLQAKQDIIEAVFNRALNDFSNLDPESYFQLLGRLIVAASEKGDELVILSPRDKERVPAGFMEGINKQLLSTGHKGDLAVAEQTRDFSGGAILQAGGVEINSSFAALLEMYREELEPAVAALLFERE